MVGLIWLGIVMGFGGDIAQHIQHHAPPYPWIVHAHAVAFVGWLVLFTAQIWLIRSKRHDIHKKLGLAMVALAIIMAILGPATALTVQRLEFDPKSDGPAFMAIQFTDILAFVLPAASGLLMRHMSSAHKRLMLLATLYISDAGFARWLGEPLYHLLGDGMWQGFVQLYGANDLLALAIGAYDLVTRRRLLPAYIAGLILTLAMQLLAGWLYHFPPWLPFTRHLLGH